MTLACLFVDVFSCRVSTWKVVMPSVFILRNWFIKSTSCILANGLQVQNEVRPVIFQEQGKLCGGPRLGKVPVLTSISLLFTRKALV